MTKLESFLLILVAVLLGVCGFLGGKVSNNIEKTVKILDAKYAQGQADLSAAIINDVTKNKKIIIPIDGQSITFVPENDLAPTDLSITK